MIWLVLVAAACVGMIRERRDVLALELASVAGLVAVSVLVSSWIHARPDAAPSAVRALTLLGGARGSEPVPYFLPAAHVAYPVLLAHSMGSLGNLGASFALVLVVSCVALALAAGHVGWDVAAGLALGELVSRAIRLGARDGRDGTARRVEKSAVVTRESTPEDRAVLRARGSA